VGIAARTPRDADERAAAPVDVLLVPAELRAAVAPRAWLEAMLEAERALAAAGAAAGLVPPEAAAEIGGACDADRYDAEALAVEGRAAGNAAEPLVRALADAVGPDASRWVHRGATSQDVVDTAAMLVARTALGAIVAEADRVAAACATLARDHRSTPMAARTLLQQAVPTTFGLKAAGWLVAVVGARDALARLRRERLAAQLGGAAGTLSAFGEHGLAVLEAFAGELGLVVPVLPWHADRTRVAELGAALGAAAGMAAKIALDVQLLAQTEVGELAEGNAGGSSTMPHKRNPVGATLARACAELASAHAGVLERSLVGEHERAAGVWQAEPAALSGALAYAGGALHALAGSLESLVVDPAAMRRNLDSTGGLVLAERIALLLMNRHPRAEAHTIVREAAARARETDTSFRDALLADPRAGLETAALDAALDPETYLGAAPALIDRALALYDARAGT
jgi:3-carboxy-cis,cis-muconate cycloisomerase